MLGLIGSVGLGAPVLAALGEDTALGEPEVIGVLLRTLVATALWSLLGPKPVQLVFRDHPQWKQHAYLVLQAGDFRCPGGCRVQVSVDGGKPRAMAAWRPDTDEAIAMFITDHAALWKLARQAQAISIEFPVKAGGTRTVVFETGGVDASQMPWK